MKRPAAAMGHGSCHARHQLKVLGSLYMAVLVRGCRYVLLQLETGDIISIPRPRSVPTSETYLHVRSLIHISRRD